MCSIKRLARQFNLNYNLRYFRDKVTTIRCGIFACGIFMVWIIVTNLMELSDCDYLNKCTPFIDLDSVNVTFSEDDTFDQCVIPKLPVMPESLIDV